MKSRARPSMERRIEKPKRNPLEIILIVCEGEVTEPNYFKQLCRKLRLTTANVTVVGRECGSDPGSVVSYAVSEFKKNRLYDHVYCVFDRDSHANYDAARQRCKDLRQKNINSKICTFSAITSNPCFEYWIYLHYGESDAPINSEGRRSPGAVMLSRLLQHMPEYQKNSENLFDFLMPKIDKAADNARRINKRDLENPHTKVIDLVTQLVSFRRDWDEDWIKNLLKDYG